VIPRSVGVDIHGTKTNQIYIMTFCSCSGALMDCNKRFGLAEVHVSNRGSYLKNVVISELNPFTRTRQSLHTAYVPFE